MPRLVHEAPVKGLGYNYRVVADGSVRVFERRGADALGGASWEPVGRFHMSGGATPLSVECQIAALAILDDLASRRDELAGTMIHGPSDGV